jgi:hypothetical protein
MRYQGTTILKDAKTGDRYYRATKYPEVPYSDSDIYIISAYGDRLDVMSFDYYKTVEDYWIILIANNLPGDSIFVKPGTQLRIPQNIEDIKQEFNRLNNIP